MDTGRWTSTCSRLQHHKLSVRTTLSSLTNTCPSQHGIRRILMGIPITLDACHRYRRITIPRTQHRSQCRGHTLTTTKTTGRRRSLDLDPRSLLHHHRLRSRTRRHLQLQTTHLSRRLRIRRVCDRNSGITVCSCLRCTTSRFNISHRQLSRLWSHLLMVPSHMFQPSTAVSE